MIVVGLVGLALVLVVDTLLILSLARRVGQLSTMVMRGGTMLSPLPGTLLEPIAVVDDHGRESTIPVAGQLTVLSFLSPDCTTCETEVGPLTGLAEALHPRGQAVAYAVFDRMPPPGSSHRPPAGSPVEVAVLTDPTASLLALGIGGLPLHVLVGPDRRVLATTASVRELRSDLPRVGV